VLTELGDWLVEGFEGEELRMVATLPQVQPEDAARVAWRMAQVKYPPSAPDDWTFRCRSTGPGGITWVRFFCVTDGVLEPVAIHPSWRPSFVEIRSSRTAQQSMSLTAGSMPTQ
jgi:hypothetical protein